MLTPVIVIGFFGALFSGVRLLDLDTYRDSAGTIKSDTPNWVFYMFGLSIVLLIIGSLF